jgi:hypothetical protein
MNMKISKYLVSAGFAAMLVLGTWTYTQAVTNGISVCVLKNGTVHVIGPDFKRDDCKTNETLLTWNAQGPKGDQGIQGPVGPKGDTGSSGTNGVNGAPGAKGDTGNSGAPGVKGDKGDTGSQGAQGTVGPSGITAYGMVFDGFLQTDYSSANLVADDIYKPTNTTGIYCIRAGVKFGGRRIYLITVLGNAGGFATVRNSSFDGCPTDYSPYISTFDKNGNAADQNFNFAII